MRPGPPPILKTTSPPNNNTVTLKPGNLSSSSIGNQTTTTNITSLDSLPQIYQMLTHNSLKGDRNADYNVSQIGFHENKNLLLPTQIKITPTNSKNVYHPFVYGRFKQNDMNFPLKNLSLSVAYRYRAANVSGYYHDQNVTKQISSDKFERIRANGNITNEFSITTPTTVLTQSTTTVLPKVNLLFINCHINAKILKYAFIRIINIFFEVTKERWKIAGKRR